MTLARRLLTALDGASLMPLPSQDDPAFDLAAAFGVAEQLRQLRVARGEKPVGYKIGFTNRGIWQRYGVHAPIWGPVWDSTVQHTETGDATLSLAAFSQPRLEPEIVFGLASTPRAGMSLVELQGCVDWVAHGFEIVHTHFEDWRFTAADTVADFALHGRLVIGPRVPAREWAGLAEDLSALRLDLHGDGVLKDSGRADIVLDGPLHALRQWVDAMARHTPAWPILPGDVVTTGTITDAWPLQTGQCWHTVLSDTRLSALRLRTEA